MRLFEFIDAEEKAYYPISLLCRILKVSRSGYYGGWKDRSPSRRDRENAALTEKIGEIHNRSRRIYGYPRRVHAELRALWECAAPGSGSHDRCAKRVFKAASEGAGNAPLAGTSAPSLLPTSSLATSPPRLRIRSGRRT